MSTTDETFVVFAEVDGKLSVLAAGDSAFSDDAIANSEAPGVRVFKRRVTSARAVYAATEEVF